MGSGMTTKRIPGSLTFNSWCYDRHAIVHWVTYVDGLGINRLLSKHRSARAAAKAAVELTTYGFSPN
jgi:hypothetical protein